VRFKALKAAIIPITVLQNETPYGLIDKKVKLPLCLIKHHAMKTNGRAQI
jgi:hypothetical protein